MSAAAASAGTAGAVRATAVGSAAVINIEVSIASWGHLILVHAPDVSVHSVEVLALLLLPVVDHCVGLRNDVLDIVSLSFNTVDSLSLLIVSTRFGIENIHVIANLFVSTEAGMFILRLTFLHNDVELSSEAIFGHVGAGRHLSIGEVS